MVETLMTTEPTRFERARAEAADAASVALSTEILLECARGIARAASLLAPTGIGGARGKTINRAEVSRTLAAVILELQDVVSEIGE